MLASVCGNIFAARSVTAAKSARASAGGTPGASRAMTRRKFVLRSARRASVSREKVTKMSLSQFGTRKSGGSTPTMACGRPLSVTTRPTTPGSPPKRRCQ